MALVGMAEGGTARRLGIVVPVGLARVLVEAVGVSLAGERAEIAVQRRVPLSERADDRQVGQGLAGPVVIEVGVVADREGVRRREGHPRNADRGRRALQEPVELAVVVLDEEALPAVVRVAVPAALVVRGESASGEARSRRRIPVLRHVKRQAKSRIQLAAQLAACGRV